MRIVSVRIATVLYCFVVMAPASGVGRGGCERELVEGSEQGAHLYSSSVDFDVNGRIDYLDLGLLAGDWLARGGRVDVDGDGIVNFGDFAATATHWLSVKKSVAVFVDSNTHAGLEAEIERYKADIANDLKSEVCVFVGNWSDIREIKGILTDKYRNDGLIGAVLIGDIPTAYFEYRNAGAMPSDWYFQDLSDKFVDSDGDGRFEREYYLNETDITMREIWTGRIKPPVGGAEGIVLLRRYFDRNHAYRTGGPGYDRKMLYFGSIAVNQDGMGREEYDNRVSEIGRYMGLYDSDSQVDSVYDEELEIQKEQYLSGLSKRYDFVFVNVHGSATTQWLGGSTSVFHQEIVDARPEGLFSVLASCSNGDFTQENYLAGWYLFSGESLAVMGNSVVTMLVGATSVDFLGDYVPLGLGVTFGSMCKNDRSFLVTHLFGDPTLSLRSRPAGSLPRLSLSESNLEFGDVKRGAKPRKNVIFTNNGETPLTIDFKKGRSSIDGEWVHLGYWDVFYYKDPDTGSTFRAFEVAPGQSKIVPFVFYPRADAPAGRYSMIMLFQTNDPENAYPTIELVGKGI